MSRNADEIAREAIDRWRDARGIDAEVPWEGTLLRAIAAAIEKDRAERGWRPTHRHYKGGYYRQIATAKHTETGEMLAIYDDDRGRLWARPLGMFVETLPDGQRRFEPLASPPEEEHGYPPCQPV